jgi:hypothetical protein
MILSSTHENYLLFSVFGPPLTAQDFINGQSVHPVTVSEATRAAIRAGIESETNNTGQYQTQ